MSDKTLSDLIYETKYTGLDGDLAVRESLASYIDDMHIINPEGPKFAIFGTSITNQNSYNSVPPQANPSRAWYSDGYATWLRILTDQRINLSINDNYGVSGNSFAQMLARIEQVVDSDPDYVIVEGGTNDFPFYSYDEIRDTWQQIVEYLRDKKITPIILPAPPRNTGVLTTAQLQTQWRFYNYQREFCRNNRGFLFCDYLGSWVNQTSSSAIPITGVVRADGVHPSATGAYYIGRALADLINPLLPPRPTEFLSAADIYSLDNPTGNLVISGSTNLGLLAGTGGVQSPNAGLTYAGSGFASLNFFQRVAGTSVATVTLNKENPRIDGNRRSGERQIVQISAASGGGADEVYSMLYTLSLSNLLDGDWYYAEASIEVTGAPANVNSLELHLLETHPSTTQFSTDLAFSSSVSGMLPAVTWKGVLRTAPLIRQADATAVQLYIRARCNTTASGSSITYKVGDVVVRKIDPLLFLTPN